MRSSLKFNGRRYWVSTEAPTPGKEDSEPQPVLYLYELSDVIEAGDKVTHVGRGDDVGVVQATFSPTGEKPSMAVVMFGDRARVAPITDLVPAEDAPVKTPREVILSATDWHENGDLIADLHALGYILDTDRVLDPTYGRGVWWKSYEPPLLTKRDRKTHPEWDYEAMLNEFEPGSFEVVAFDPDYVAQGGRKTVGVAAKDFEDRYGLKDSAATPQKQLESICMGINNAYPLLVPGGILLVKTMNYVSSGKLFPQAHFIWAHATMAMDFQYVDELTHVGHAGMQPPSNLDGSPRRQVHARQNASVMFVFRKPGRRPKIKKGTLPNGTQ